MKDIVILAILALAGLFLLGGSRNATLSNNSAAKNIVDTYIQEQKPMMIAYLDNCGNLDKIQEMDTLDKRVVIAEKGEDYKRVHLYQRDDKGDMQGIAFTVDKKLNYSNLRVVDWAGNELDERTNLRKYLKTVVLPPSPHVDVESSSK